MGLTQHVLASDLDAPARSRRMIETWMAGHPRRHEAVLATSEIVANAVTHGAETAVATGVTLRFESTVAKCRVTVGHGGSAFDPVMNRRRVHGLGLVERVADRWGIDSADGCVEVWFELDSSADEGPRRLR